MMMCMLACVSVGHGPWLTHFLGGITSIGLIGLIAVSMYRLDYWIFSIELIDVDWIFSIPSGGSRTDGLSLPK
jgi:hypothetical protein